MHAYDTIMNYGIIYLLHFPCFSLIFYQPVCSEIFYPPSYATEDNCGICSCPFVQLKLLKFHFDMLCQYLYFVLGIE